MTSLRTYVSTFLFITVVSSVGYAQQDDVVFDHLSVDDGLSNNNVRSIVQDSLGFIWISTEEGLNRFDGYAFKTYRHDSRDSASLSADGSIILCVDSRGNLWSSGGKGLDRYDRARDNFMHYVHDPHRSNSLPSNYITAIAVDKNDNLWIASDSGLTCFDEQRNTSFTIKSDPTYSNRISDNIIGCILAERNGTLWIGYGSGGIDRLDQRDAHDPGNIRVTRYRHDPGDKRTLSDDRITSMTKDAEGRLWVGTFGGGLNRFDPSTDQFVPFSSRDSLNPGSEIRAITSLMPDSKGNLWVGFFNEGLGRYDLGTRRFVHYQADLYDPYALNSDRVYALLKDRSGTIWIGTHRGGVNRFDPRKNKFRHVRHLKDNENSLSAGVVSALREDRTGGIWAGLEDGGLDYYDPATRRYTHYRHDPGNPFSIGSNVVLALLEDHLGTIWIQTSQGLDEFDKSSRRFYHHLYGSPFGESRALFEDVKGNIWLGTIDSSVISLTYLDRATMRFVRSSLSKVGAEIQFIFQDSAGALWYGTFGAGLYRLDRGADHGVHYLHDPGHPATIGGSGLYSLACDREGTLWIGLYGGLDRYNRATDSFEHFTERDGLASNYVKAILPDDRGSLWLSTTKGLSRFDPERRRFKNFGLEDGVQGNEFRTGSSFKTKDGRMYFGGVNGYNVFHPDSIRDNPVPPPVVLTSFKVFDKPRLLVEPISTTTMIQLSYSEDVFSFEFVALNYTNSGKNQYAYKMSGFDKDWVYCSTRRYANYTHLDPGEYTFHVKACNNDGIWNEVGASVTLIIVPPYWKTWWFQWSAVLLIIVSLAWTIRSIEMRKIREKMVRLEREAALERERTRIARDMHDDLGARLTEIRLLSELSQRNPTDHLTMKSNLHEISESARDIVDSFQEIVWSVNPKYDTLDNFADFLTQYTSGYLGKAGLRCRLDIPSSVPIIKVSTEIRHNMMMAVKEVLNNTVKHAAAEEVALNLTCEDRHLSVVIRDNGKGFSPDNVRKFGNGLVNMRRRLEAIGGEIEIESRPGHGTTVALSVMLEGWKK